MSKEIREKIENLYQIKKGLPDCPKKKEIENEIQNLKKQIDFLADSPFITVKHAGKAIGRLEYDKGESCWGYRNGAGFFTEIGFTYEDAKNWASMNGYQLKVE